MADNLPFKFLYNPKTNYSPGLEFFNLNLRNQCFSGGYGSTKTYTACFKLLTLLSTFPNSRAVIGRLKSTDLKRTTLPTFFKVCPPELYDERKGGRRADSQNTVRLINGSEIQWMHFDEFDEGSVRGLEVNWILIDQAEELPESVYTHLDARIGRWDRAEVPPTLLAANPNWPVNSLGKHRVPGYMMILCNPDNELHWIWNRFHPDSSVWKERYSATHRMITASALDNPTYDQETLDQMLSKDKQFVDRYVFGRWGFAEGAIHYVSPKSKLYCDQAPGPEVEHLFGSPDADKIYITKEWIDNLLCRSNIYRILDHGDISPTSCLWLAVTKGFHFVFREYYLEDKLISDHRANIEALSPRTEQVVSNISDPAIFMKNSQKYGGMWSVADEYLDTRITDAKPIYWRPADNNEFATRNRVSELLRIDPKLKHPITNEEGSPRLFFIMKTSDYPQGAYHSVIQTSGQKRKLLGTIDGKQIYSEERDSTIPDHAYDCIRYLSSLHANGSSDTILKPRKGSFFDVRKQFLMNKLAKAIS